MGVSFVPTNVSAWALKIPPSQKSLCISSPQFTIIAKAGIYNVKCKFRAQD